jgi:hypothetical protein
MEDSRKPSDSPSPMAAIAPLAGLPRQILYQSAFSLLSRPIHEPSAASGLVFVSELRPRPEDYARVFQAPYVEAARRVYDALFLAPRPLERGAHQTVLRLSMATASELREFGPETCEFPGGYADILDLLLPESLWVHWKYVAPGSSSGMSYDGLTRLEDRWVWFPKPYRFLLAQLQEPKAEAVVPEAPAVEAKEAPAAEPPSSQSQPANPAAPGVTQMWKE